MQDQRLEVAEQFLAVPCLQGPSLRELSCPTNVMLFWLPWVRLGILGCGRHSSSFLGGLPGSGQHPPQELVDYHTELRAPGSWLCRGLFGGP